jgi:predicted Ser/Thr protein kinase
MTPQRHEQVKSLFLAVCDLSEADRSKALDESCRNDPELRKEVESLLRHHRPETIIEQPASPGLMPLLGPEVPAGDQTSLVTPSIAAEVQPRFVVGTIIAQRYRVAGLLGRGGMGEVYRAEDLTLRRTVALKFLARGRAEDPSWLARFHNEVRLSLTITHPNICRVYDIGQADGEVFISMEYIDGENLASLLRRIGRLPQQKAVQIIRQICFGLAAAHRRGILHRDLKPENIMLDNRGDVRITDFGIAVLTEPGTQGAVLIGTPAYMAPELLLGGPATVASDIFGLGALMYEVVTGAKAFDAEAVLRGGQRPEVVAPSKLAEDVDPAIEDLILQCLRTDPRERPASVDQVLLSIPGTDPLAAALAAGELPAPELVAGARTRTAHPALAVAMAIGAVLGLAAIVALANRTFLLAQAGLARAPAVLEDKAEQVVQRLQGLDVVSGRSEGFFVDPIGLEWTCAHAGRGRPWNQILLEQQNTPLYFEYQVGGVTYYPRGPMQRPRAGRQPQLGLPSGLTTVRLDPQGRLLLYSRVLERPLAGTLAPRTPDWAAAFELAGLRIETFQTRKPFRQPPLFGDVNVAWQGPRPAGAGEPITVEGAAVDDQVVFFTITQEWDQPSQQKEVAQAVAGTQMIARGRYVLIFLSMMGGLLLAWRNLRLGRGDRRGAWRLATFTFLLALAHGLVKSRHAFDPIAEIDLFLAGLQYAVFGSFVIWCCYIALEPYVRQLWPQSIISWSRLLIGRVRDPLIGADILAGILVGVGIVLLQQASVLVRPWRELARSLPILPRFAYELGELTGTRFEFQTLIISLLAALWIGFVFLLVMLLLRVMLRVSWLAGLAFLVVATGLSAVVFETTTSFPWITHAIIAAGMGVTLVRVGLLPAIVGLLVTFLLTGVPMTSDFRAWYSGSAIFAMLTILILLGCGLYVSFPVAARSRSGG